MSRIVLYLLVIASLGFANQSKAMSLRELRSKVFSQVNSMNSIQFTYTFNSQITYENSEKTREIQGKVEYLQNGRMYYIKTVAYKVGRGGEDEISITAYDGDRYQMFGTNGKHEKELDYKKTELTKIPSMYPNPLILIYSWIAMGGAGTTNRDTTLSTLSDMKNGDLWDNCFKKAMLMDTSSDGDSRIKFMNPKVDKTIEVTFDSDRGFLPVSISIPPNETALIDEVVMKEDSEGSRFYLPIKVTGMKKNETHTATLTYQIDPDSIIVNGDIDKDKFTIPESMADTVINVDAAEANKEIIPRPKSSLYMKMSLGVLGIILIVIGIYGKRRNRKISV